MPKNDDDDLGYRRSTNVERRTWDKETYEARARARSAAADAAAAGTDDRHHRPSSGPGQPGTGDDNANQDKKEEGGGEKEEFRPAERGRAGPERSQRAYLKARSAKVDLEGKLGTTEIVAPEAAAVSGGGAVGDDAAAVKHTDGITKSAIGVGWHCKVCDCYLKDSLTYLDHINGRKHQRALGYSMRAEKSTTAEVGAKLSALANAQRAAAGTDKFGVGGSSRKGRGDEGGNEFEDLVRAKDEEALRRKAERARRREERKRKEEEEAKQQMENGGVVGGGGDDEEEYEVEGMDPAMAAMMGFSGFGGGNKNR